MEEKVESWRKLNLNILPPGCPELPQLHLRQFTSLNNESRCVGTRESAIQNTPKVTSAEKANRG
jgi:hypothetical protein